MNDSLKSIIHGKPQVHVGKNGLSPAVLKQIEILLEKKKIIKIRFLTIDNFESIDQAANFVVSKTKAKILDIRGKSVVLQSIIH